MTLGGSYVHQSGVTVVRTANGSSSADRSLCRSGYCTDNWLVEQRVVTVRRRDGSPFDSSDIRTSGKAITASKLFQNDSTETTIGLLVSVNSDVIVGK